MGYHPSTRCREYMEGWLGRRRTYTCIECSAKFQVDTLRRLPQIERVCTECSKYTYVYKFVDKRKGREKLIRASDTELATLRAWKINPNLTFKVERGNANEHNN